jgi:uncharacterized membrane protein
VAVWLAPASPAGGAASAPESGATSGATSPVTAASLFPQVQAIVNQRCVMCHNAQLANKGVMLHEPALIESHAQQVYQQAVVLKAMPMNNATGITDAERALLGQWFKARQAGAAPGAESP